MEGLSPKRLLRKLIVQLGAAKESFWFLPGLLTTAAAMLSFVTLEIDDRLELSRLGTGAFGNVGSADGARTLLATIAGSMITVANLTFAITITTLTMAGNQYGPRLIRNFIRDTGNQIVLGTFVATFTYSLLILRTIRGGEDTFVPAISLGVALGLAITSVAVLIYFISHIAVSIQVNHVISTIGNDLTRVIKKLYPEERDNSDEATPEEEDGWRLADDAHPVYADRSGYIQEVDYGHLVATASEASSVIHVPYQPGRFITKGALVAEVKGGAQPASTDELNDRIMAAFTLGTDRAALQDVEFYIDQLVEIALRALSPSLNDPFTAIACLDQLGASLRHLAEQGLPSPIHRDENGEIRLYAKTQTFEGAINAAFNPIRQNSQANVQVSTRLMEKIAVLAAHASSPEDKDVLLHHARMVINGVSSEVREPTDLDAMQERFQAVLDALEAGSPAESP